MEEGRKTIRKEDGKGIWVDHWIALSVLCSASHIALDHLEVWGGRRQVGRKRRKKRRKSIEYLGVCVSPSLCIGLPPPLSFRLVPHLLFPRPLRGEQDGGSASQLPSEVWVV